jgi:hypothetical protein
MRAISLVALLLTAASPAGAQDATGRPEEVPACTSLVALRQLVVEAGEDRLRAVAQVSRHPGCRLVPRDRIGAVERRAMVGGAPYECFTVRETECLWVMP